MATIVNRLFSLDQLTNVNSLFNVLESITKSISTGQKSTIRELEEYIEKSPKCTELFSVWTKIDTWMEGSNATSSNNNDSSAPIDKNVLSSCIARIWWLISYIIDNGPSIESRYIRTAGLTAQAANRCVQNHLLQSYYTWFGSKRWEPECGALRLLTSVASAGSIYALQILRYFNFGFQGFLKLADVRYTRQKIMDSANNTMKIKSTDQTSDDIKRATFIEAAELTKKNLFNGEDSRGCFINLALALVSSPDLAVVNQALRIRNYFSKVFMNLHNDSTARVQKVFSVFYTHVLSNPGIPRGRRAAFFASNCLTAASQMVAAASSLINHDIKLQFVASYGSKTLLKPFSSIQTGKTSMAAKSNSSNNEHEQDYEEEVDGIIEENNILAHIIQQVDQDASDSDYVLLNNARVLVGFIKACTVGFDKNHPALLVQSPHAKDISTLAGIASNISPAYSPAITSVAIDVLSREPRAASLMLPRLCRSLNLSQPKSNPLIWMQQATLLLRVLNVPGELQQVKAGLFFNHKGGDDVHFSLSTLLDPNYTVAVSDYHNVAIQTFMNLVLPAQSFMRSGLMNALMNNSDPKIVAVAISLVIATAQKAKKILDILESRLEFLTLGNEAQQNIRSNLMSAINDRLIDWTVLISLRQRIMDAITSDDGVLISMRNASNESKAPVHDDEDQDDVETSDLPPNQLSDSDDDLDIGMSFDNNSTSNSKKKRKLDSGSDEEGENDTNNIDRAKRTKNNNSLITSHSFLDSAFLICQGCEFSKYLSTPPTASVSITKKDVYELWCHAALAMVCFSPSEASSSVDWPRVLFQSLPSSDTFQNPASRILELKIAATALGGDGSVSQRVSKPQQAWLLHVTSLWAFGTVPEERHEGSSSLMHMIKRSGLSTPAKRRVSLPLTNESVLLGSVGDDVIWPCPATLHATGGPALCLALVSIAASQPLIFASEGLGVKVRPSMLTCALTRQITFETFTKGFSIPALERGANEEERKFDPVVAATAAADVLASLCAINPLGDMTSSILSLIEARGEWRDISKAPIDNKTKEKIRTQATESANKIRMDLISFLNLLVNSPLFASIFFLSAFLEEPLALKSKKSSSSSINIPFVLQVHKHLTMTLSAISSGHSESDAASSVLESLITAALPTVLMAASTGKTSEIQGLSKSACEPSSLVDLAAKSLGALNSSSLIKFSGRISAASHSGLASACLIASSQIDSFVPCLMPLMAVSIKLCENACDLPPIILDSLLSFMCASASHFGIGMAKAMLGKFAEMFAHILIGKNIKNQKWLSEYCCISQPSESTQKEKNGKIIVQIMLLDHLQVAHIDHALLPAFLSIAARLLRTAGDIKDGSQSLTSRIWVIISRLLSTTLKRSNHKLTPSHMTTLEESLLEDGAGDEVNGSVAMSEHVCDAIANEFQSLLASSTEARNTLSHYLSDKFQISNSDDNSETASKNNAPPSTAVDVLLSMSLAGLPVAAMVSSPLASPANSSALEGRLIASLICKSISALLSDSSPLSLSKWQVVFAGLTRADGISLPHLLDGTRPCVIDLVHNQALKDEHQLQESNEEINSSQLQSSLELKMVCVSIHMMLAVRTALECMPCSTGSQKDSICQWALSIASGLIEQSSPANMLSESDAKAFHAEAACRVAVSCISLAVRYSSGTTTSAAWSILAELIKSLESSLKDNNSNSTNGNKKRVRIASLITRASLAVPLTRACFAQTFPTAVQSAIDVLASLAKQHVKESEAGPVILANLVSIASSVRRMIACLGAGEVSLLSKTPLKAVTACMESAKSSLKRGSRAEWVQGLVEGLVENANDLDNEGVALIRGLVEVALGITSLQTKIEVTNEEGESRRMRLGIPETWMRMFATVYRCSMFAMDCEIRELLCVCASEEPLIVNDLIFRSSPFEMEKSSNDLVTSSGSHSAQEVSSVDSRTANLKRLFPSALEMPAHVSVKRSSISTWSPRLPLPNLRSSIEDAANIGDSLSWLRIAGLQNIIRNFPANSISFIRTPFAGQPSDETPPVLQPLYRQYDSRIPVPSTLIASAATRQQLAQQRLNSLTSQVDISYLIMSIVPRLQMAAIFAAGRGVVVSVGSDLSAQGKSDVTEEILKEINRRKREKNQSFLKESNSDEHMSEEEKKEILELGNQLVDAETGDTVDHANTAQSSKFKNKAVFITHREFTLRRISHAFSKETQPKSPEAEALSDLIFKNNATSRPFLETLTTLEGRDRFVEALSTGGFVEILMMGAGCSDKYVRQVSLTGLSCVYDLLAESERAARAVHSSLPSLMRGKVQLKNLSIKFAFKELPSLVQLLEVVKNAIKPPLNCDSPPVAPWSVVSWASSAMHALTHADSPLFAPLSKFILGKFALDGRGILLWDSWLAGDRPNTVLQEREFVLDALHALACYTHADSIPVMLCNTDAAPTYTTEDVMDVISRVKVESSVLTVLTGFITGRSKEDWPHALRIAAALRAIFERIPFPSMPVLSAVDAPANVGVELGNSTVPQEMLGGDIRAVDDCAASRLARKAIQEFAISSWVKFAVREIACRTILPLSFSSIQNNAQIAPLVSEIFVSSATHRRGRCLAMSGSLSFLCELSRLLRTLATSAIHSEHAAARFVNVNHGQSTANSLSLSAKSVSGLWDLLLASRALAQVWFSFSEIISTAYAESQSEDSQKSVRAQLDDSSLFRQVVIMQKCVLDDIVQVVGCCSEAIRAISPAVSRTSLLHKDIENCIELIVMLGDLLELHSIKTQKPGNISN